jgi:formyl-CoA transferase
MIVSVDHPTRGIFKTVGCPLKLSDSPVTVERSPLLSEHTDEILKDVLGYGGEDIAGLRAEGAI